MGNKVPKMCLSEKMLPLKSFNYILASIEQNAVPNFINQLRLDLINESGISEKEEPLLPKIINIEINEKPKY